QVAVTEAPRGRGPRRGPAPRGPADQGCRGEALAPQAGARARPVRGAGRAGRQRPAQRGRGQVKQNATAPGEAPRGRGSNRGTAQVTTPPPRRPGATGDPVPGRQPPSPDAARTLAYPPQPPGPHIDEPPAERRRRKRGERLASRLREYAPELLPVLARLLAA